MPSLHHTSVVDLHEAVSGPQRMIAAFGHTSDRTPRGSHCACLAQLLWFGCHTIDLSQCHFLFCAGNRMSLGHLFELLFILQWTATNPPASEAQPRSCCFISARSSADAKKLFPNTFFPSQPSVKCTTIFPFSPIAR